MIDADAIYRRYKALRKKGYPAESAARNAVNPPDKPDMDWTNGAASVEIGPYTVEIKQEYDPDPDLSWLGMYSNLPGPDAIDRAKTSAGTRANEFRYWNPTITLDEHYRGLHRLGYSKADAWLKALEYREQDYNRIERFCRGDWAMLGIVAVARIGGMECGTASLWGIESDNDEYIDAIALEMAHEAAHAAAANRDSMIRARAEEIVTLASTPRRSV